MPRTCTICGHDEAHAINVALVQREPYRRIAARYSVAETSLRRHAGDHLPELLVEAKEAVDSAESDDLMGELSEVKADVKRLKDRAEDEGDLRTALQGCDKALKALELHAKVKQLVNDAPQINLYLSPEWLEIRGVIVTALEPYSAARGAVLKAIEGVGNGRA